MGLSHSWIAVQGARLDAVLETLGMVGGEAVENHPRRAGIAELPSGWIVVLISHPEKAFSPPFSKLAALGPAVACAEEEHVMYSEARGYRDGQEVWRVVRDPEAEPDDHIEVTGEPPPALSRIRDAAVAEQAAENDADHIFEIPPLLAKEICGFRILDEWPEGVTFTELERKRSAAPSGPGFFARLFGRR